MGNGLEDVLGHPPMAPAWVEAGAGGEPASAGGHMSQGSSAEAQPRLRGQHPAGPGTYVGVGRRRESRSQLDISSFQDKWVPLVAARPRSRCFPLLCPWGLLGELNGLSEGRGPKESWVQELWGSGLAPPFSAQSNISPGLIPSTPPQPSLDGAAWLSAAFPSKNLVEDETQPL